MLALTTCISWRMQEGRGRGEGWSSQGSNQSQGGSSHSTPTKEDELTKQLKYQKCQIDALVGQARSLVSAMRATQASSSRARPGGFGRQTPSTWRGGSRGRGLPLQTQSEPLPSLKPEAPSKSRGLSRHTSVGNVERWGI